MDSTPPFDSSFIFMMFLFLRSIFGISLQGRKLFDPYEESIQEFKWHCFKVLSAPSKRAFWLDDEDSPFPWVYWNPEVKEFTIHNLDPLETVAFKFLVSLPAGLPKKSNFTCRWILDHSDVEVGKFLDDLLDVKMKRTKLDRLLAQMADPSRMALRAILPTGGPSATAAAAAAAATAVADSTPAASSSQVPPAHTASAVPKAKKQSSKYERPKRSKGKDGDAFDRVLGDEFSCEYEVSPIDVAYPEEFNFRKALDAGLTLASARESLVTMPPEQLLGESYRYSAKSLACLQVRLETSFAARVKAEKELSSTLDGIEVLKAERGSLAYREEKTSSLTEQLSQKEVELQSALDWVAYIEKNN
ncbi:hypothetical protein PIB30_013152 [Stylosanthes scabra]|uniref:Uncharacterized protein n=1 Tax=Stylosanthes scabra TaxID=79078 RepID=A0ABU6Y874_9FABA|nr:hypothetical protein [Stylosanthes scabra]